MIRTLRKRHLQAWSLLALLIPVGIIAAYVSIKKPNADKLLQPATVKELPFVTREIEKDSYLILIRRNENASQYQLQWINKAVLTVPTATIFKAPLHSTDISEGELIGRIEARGSYQFAIDSSFNKGDFKLIVYDFIHKQIIDSIKF
ncbi:MAG: hypothetical protein ACKVOW_11890 [Chitinophagaceae bacterium]